MEITEVFYPHGRSQWREWLETHHQSKTEIWLRTFRKASAKPSIAYDDMVEECLCFGWIDGVVKKYCEESRVQRITPRRKKNTFLSELNRQRVWKLQRQGLMTPAGLAPIHDQVGAPDDPWEIPEWIEAQLRAEQVVWENFQQFSHFYQRLKIGWIKECGPRRQEEAQKRLNYLVKMTRQGKMYGTVPEVE
ncbi:MAG: YdeI/OmpD-associated family protein [Phaeodactylibacter sp.]|nr:YdeI/OmpD-associated family protein [Phaeodactylibacter sp.]MCB9052262.1 YdeI/OmpD-associated family protein [Lewinellaceae bacterium]